MIVPYCDACHRHLLRLDTVRIAAIYGSVLLSLFGGTLLAVSWDSTVGTTAIACLLSALPLAWSRRIALPRQLGHAARGKAVMLVPRGMACTSEAFAALAGARSRKAVSPLVIRRPKPLAAELFGPLMALLLTPSLHYVFFPQLRVVNFTDRTIRVVVDERTLGSVEPTSGESPAAGKILRVPSGHHRLRAIDSEGGVASDVQVKIEIGFRHLYAPGAKEGCFYLDRVAYGRSRFEGVGRETLRSEQRFWILPREVDSWFTPERTQRDSPTTGGVVTLLRMGNCR